MNNIKLVACDIDGTLLQSGQTEIAPAVFDQIRRLAKKGILFCPASGRQYNSLRKLFAPVADEISYICENGSAIFGAGNPGPLIDKTVIARETAYAVCRQILSFSGCEILISGENTSYVITENTEYVRHLREDVGNHVCVIQSPEEIPEEIIKISVFCPMGGAPRLPILTESFGNILDVALSGVQWIDVTLANKGTGIRSVCRGLGISLEEVMAIGDNYNDIPILSIVGHPCIMENAAEELVGRFENKCRRVEDTLAVL